MMVVMLMLHLMVDHYSCQNDKSNPREIFRDEKCPKKIKMFKMCSPLPETYLVILIFPQLAIFVDIFCGEIV